MYLFKNRSYVNEEEHDTDTQVWSSPNISACALSLALSQPHDWFSSVLFSLSPAVCAVCQNMHGRALSTLYRLCFVSLLHDNESDGFFSQLWCWFTNTLWRPLWRITHRLLTNKHARVWSSEQSARLSGKVSECTTLSAVAAEALCLYCECG